MRLEVSRLTMAAGVANERVRTKTAIATEDGLWRPALSSTG
jgi:hypothetical protein